LNKPVIRCYITDRRSLPPGVSILDVISRSHVGWVQIRERDLPSRELFDLVRAAVSTHAKIIVNTRMDIALAAGATGVHLPSGSPPPDRWRSIAPPGFLIGVSCHRVDEVRAAAQHGADYVVFGPIFTPRSKPTDLEPRGLDLLAQAVEAAPIPVLALGGITTENGSACIGRGAAGIAAISLFQRP
jgi:thiamine-phosphate diphosphorylase